MKATVPALCCAAVLYGCASQPIERLVTGETPAGWHVANQAYVEGKGAIREFVPAGEVIEQWRHLATIQFLEHEKKRPIEFMRGLEQMMMKRCPAATWTVLEETPDSVLYQWQIRDCQGHEDQVELSRLVQGVDGLHRIGYTEKGATMNEEARAYWMGVLKKARVEEF